ncbi:PREDICTED: UBN2_3 domain-containing [Prunus dulcis]|uniref:PREDICTED: UBN2_3 domain-containing n=1 Tax=Prunus dulcis TaxID=3755 RepID=A0A5E4FPT7_PRUDU|nr:PREDICTED: UBN2_3 domain-containing [Prunus dulcis]VVA29485.1 PREDICTED: UBN2_3 domain-containing [Prunus dulcis]
MLTASQLVLAQSPISSLIPTVGNTVTVKLDDTNYVTWNFQMELLLRGHGVLGFVDGSMPCPAQFTSAAENHTVSDAYQVWKIHDNALMILKTATLSSSAISYVIGNQSSCEMWLNLKERFASISRTSIFQMKTDLQNIKKGPKSVDQYLKKINDSRDQLSVVGVNISDEVKPYLIH